MDPLTGRKYIAARAPVPEVTAKIHLRCRQGVLTSARVIHSSTAYGTESVIDIRSAGP